VRKIAVLLVFLYASIVPVFAQDKAVREDLWVCPVFETGFYGLSNMAMGGGLAVGYGDRMAFGIKTVYWRDMDEVRALELNVLARFYFFSERATVLGAGNSGLFIQFNGGPVIFAKGEDTISIPSDTVALSAGLSLGWRFLFGRYFFIEPAIRGGIPYIAGAGLSAGLRF
jgi:hypothetical protein